MLKRETIAESYRVLNAARKIAEAPAAGEPDVRAAARPVQPGHALPHSKARKHSHAESRVPPGTFSHERSTLEEIGQLINDAEATGSNEELAKANKAGWEKIHRLQHSRGEPESDEMFDWRVCNEYPGISTAVVAARERSNEGRVRKAREAAGLDSKGRKTTTSPDD